MSTEPIKLKLFLKEYELAHDGLQGHGTVVSGGLILRAASRYDGFIVMLSEHTEMYKALTLTGWGRSLDEAVKNLEIEIMRHVAALKVLMEAPEDRAICADLAIQLHVDNLPNWVSFMLGHVVDGFVKSGIIKEERRVEFESRIKVKFLEAIRATIEDEVLFKVPKGNKTEN